MVGLLRRVVTSLGFLPEIKHRNPCESVFSVSPGAATAAPPEATNHYAGPSDAAVCLRVVQCKKNKRERERKPTNSLISEPASLPSAKGSVRRGV